MSDRPTVLIVDDVPENLAVLFTTLRAAQFHVLVAESGESALERLANVEPDVILLDILMPGLDGFQTCQRIKANEQTASIPVLFLSALDEAVDKVRGFQVGGVDYITKPIEVEEVVARVNTHIRLRQLQRDAERQNERLEARVQERTAELVEEVAHRKKNEAEKHKLLDMLGKQSDQLRDMTHWLIDSQQGRHQETLTTLQQNIQQQLAQLESYLQAVSANLQTNPASALTSLQDALMVLTQMQTSLPRDESQIISMAEQEVLEGPLLKLTAREREVLQLITDGKSYGEIAELLYLSETTILSHRSRLMQKLGIDDLPRLVKFAIRHGLSTLD